MTSSASSCWYTTYDFPITLPTGPLSYDDNNFEQLFVKTTVYNEIDKFLDNIEKQYGTFWISSPGGGYGKSTMLSYIARILYLRIGELRALPIYVRIIKPYETLEHAFFKGFLKGFAEVGEGFKLASTIPKNMEHIVIKDFKRKRQKIQDFLLKLPTKKISELESYFYNCLRILDGWKNKAIFHKYVLLIDEMDKVKHEDVLDFLGGNQGRFEELYKKHGFVAFISGHKPWVNRIFETTEYSFYRGSIFRLRPIIDINDIKKLVESRLIIYALMRPVDIPLTDEAYKELRKLTAGIPRRIIQLVQEILNVAYEKRVPSVSASFISKCTIEERFTNKLIEFLQTHYETYEKLRKTVDEGIDNVLYVFYDFSPSHEIPKDPYDRDVDARTRETGLELTNEEWRESIEKLLRFGCIEDRGNKRTVSNDLISFFDILEGYPPVKSRIVPSLIRNLRGRITLPSIELSTPQFFNAIDRAFKIYPNKWLSREEILRCFKDTTVIGMYIQTRFRGKDFNKISRELFKKHFKKYIRQMKDHIMVYKDGRLIFYRKLPKHMSMDDYEKLKMLPREIIDKYIELIVKSDKYDYEIIRELDMLIEELIVKLGSKMNIGVESEFLRHRTRNSILKKLKISEKLKPLIDSYVRLTKQEPFETNVIRELARSIIFRLSDLILTAKPIEEYELLRMLENDLRKIIERELSRISSKWWIERIPPDVRENAERRKSKEEYLWPWLKPSEKYSPIMYINFSEYSKIICLRNNWREVFKDIFKDEDLIKSRLKELEYIRNKIMHFRKLTSREKEKLRIFVKDIRDYIKLT